MPDAGRASKRRLPVGLATADVFAIVLPALGIGILLGSMGAARGQSLFGTSLFVPLARIVCVGASVLFAVLLKNNSVKRPVLFAAAVALSLVQLGSALLTPVFGESERFALGVIATIAEGASLSLVMFLLLSNLLGRSQKEIAVAIAAGFVVLNVYDCFFIGASDEACTVQWLIGKILALAIAGTVVVRSKSGVDPDAGQQSFLRVESDRIADGAVGEHRAAHRLVVVKLLPFACLVAILFLLQGVYSYLTGLGGVGANALFDMTVGIYVVGVRLLVFGFCLIAKEELKPVTVACAGILLWVLGLLLTTVLWNTDIRFMGALALNSGLYIMQPLILILAVQLARRNREHAMPILFSMIALEYSNHITRLVTLFFIPDPSVIQFESLSLVSVVSLAVVAASSVLYLMLSRWAPASEPAPLPKGFVVGEIALSNEELSSHLLQKEIEQFRRFRLLCEDRQLTKREEEVLYEAMHGYSIDHIAERLCLSRQTVKTYLSRSYNRLGVSSKQEALKLLDTYNA